MHRPAVYENRQTELEDSIQNRIRLALSIPDIKTGLADFANARQLARMKLDATLERDIGASIYPPRDQMNETLQRLTEPLRRKIQPMIWIKALERYLRTYTDLAVLSGIPVKE